jgi:hypothetical protein
MSKFLKISGIAVLIGCAILLIAVLPDTIDILFVIIVIAFIAIFGLLLIAVGDLMDRVDSLENSLELHKEQTEHEDKIMQITCPNCGKQYDIDYPKCPHCGDKGI